MAFIKSFKGQNWLLPPSIEDMISEDHICYLVEAIVERVDFSKYEVRYSGPGHPAYHPRIIVKILLQSMLDKVRSSRNIARQARENVVYIYLAEKLTPDFRTISDFRKSNSNLLKELFKQTIEIAKELGVLGLDHLSIDGSKLKACASNRSTVTDEELHIIEEYVHNEIQRGIELDKLEDKHFKDFQGYEQLPFQSKKKIKSIVAKFLKQVKKNPDEFIMINEKIQTAEKEMKDNDLVRVSLTDPESRFMKNKKGRSELSYNPQITTDNKAGIIIANDVCQEVTDHHQLQPQLDLTEKNCGQLQEGTKISADNGYWNGENIHYLNGKKLDGYIPDQKQAQKSKGKKIDISIFDKQNFLYDDEKDIFICPEKKKLIFLSQTYSKKRKKMIRTYAGTECATCLLNTSCTKRKDRIRRVKAYPYEKERREMKEKMETQEAKKIFQRRKETAELPYGHIKYNLGFTDFLTNGLKGAKNEFSLACTSFNLRRIWNIMKKMRIKMKDLIHNYYSIIEEVGKSVILN